jgi:hypothetical protein
MDPFDRVVRSEDELREILGTPSARSLAKQHDSLDMHDRAFIALSPLILMSTSGADGRCDVSPKGDGPGFVLVIDERRLVIPDRPGNKEARRSGQDAAPRHRCGGGRGLPPLPEGVSEVSLLGFGQWPAPGALRSMACVLFDRSARPTSRFRTTNATSKKPMSAGCTDGRRMSAL